MNDPSGGIIFGYFFDFCLAISSADNWGPGYLGASLRSRAGWDGGLNFEGFSRTRGLDFELFFLFEALRIVREVGVGIESRVRHIELLCGSRNRGIDAVGGMVYGEAPGWSSGVCWLTPRIRLQILVRRPHVQSWQTKEFLSVICRPVPSCMWLNL